MMAVVALAQAPPSHDAFDQLLKRYVLDDGRVDYKGFIKDSVDFDQYLANLSSDLPG